MLVKDPGQMSASKGASMQDTHFAAVGQSVCEAIHALLLPLHLTYPLAAVPLTPGPSLVIGKQTAYKKVKSGLADICSGDELSKCFVRRRTERRERSAPWVEERRYQRKQQLLEQAFRHHHLASTAKLRQHSAAPATQRQQSRS